MMKKHKTLLYLFYSYLWYEKCPDLNLAPAVHYLQLCPCIAIIQFEYFLYYV